MGVLTGDASDALSPPQTLSGSLLIPLYYVILAITVRPINNFHESCKAFFPSKIPMHGSLVEVLVGQGGKDGSAAFCVEPQGTT